MKIKRFICGGLESNCYVIYHNPQGNCYIVDPGGRGDEVVDFISSEGLNLKGILLTHHHHDHRDAVPRIVARTGCPVYLHRCDADMYGNAVDTMLEEGDTILLDDEKIKVMNTPGHTEGSVCYVAESSKVAFTGDTIFSDDIGRTDLRDGDDKKMHKSCKRILEAFSNDMVVYPGHGDSASMKQVKVINDYFNEYSK